MAFWTTDGAGDDPKRGYRFKIIFTGMLAGESMIWWAKKCGKPNFTITETKHQFLNHAFHWPGRVEWQPITMTLVDPVKPSSVEQITDLIVKSGYQLPADSNGSFATMSKSKAQAALGEIQIIQMDAEGGALETWVLKNPWIKSAKFGDLAYDSDDLTEIEMELRYDWAQLDGTTTSGVDDRFKPSTA